MTDEEISRIKEHIEIHARREPASIKITEIMHRAVAELEHIAELKREIADEEIRTDNTKTLINALERIAELEEKIDKIRNYLAYDIPHELINEATNKIWHMI